MGGRRGIYIYSLTAFRQKNSAYRPAEYLTARQNTSPPGIRCGCLSSGGDLVGTRLRRLQDPLLAGCNPFLEVQDWGRPACCANRLLCSRTVEWLSGWMAGCCWTEASCCRQRIHRIARRSQRICSGCVGSVMATCTAYRSCGRSSYGTASSLPVSRSPGDRCGPVGWGDSANCLGDSALCRTEKGVQGSVRQRYRNPSLHHGARPRPHSKAIL